MLGWDAPPQSIALIVKYWSYRALAYSSDSILLQTHRDFQRQSSGNRLNRLTFRLMRRQPQSTCLLTLTRVWSIWCFSGTAANQISILFWRPLLRFNSCKLSLPMGVWRLNRSDPNIWCLYLWNATFWKYLQSWQQFRSIPPILQWVRRPAW